MNKQEQLLEEILFHIKSLTTLYISSFGVQQVEENVYRTDEHKGIEVKNSDGSTFAVMEKGMIVTTDKLNKGITLNINISENTSAKDLFRILSEQFNKLGLK